MKWIKAAGVFILLFGVLMNSAAWAHHPYFNHHHRHAHVGVFFSAPLPWYYPPQSYYTPYPPLIATPSSPPVYIERSDLQQAQPQAPEYWWYYCGNPQGYYPYVKACSVDWQKVAPTPPPQS